MLLKDIPVVDGHTMTEDLRIGDLHHGGLHMERPQDTLELGILNLLFQELPERLHAHEGCIEHFPRLQGDLFFQYGRFAVGSHKFDLRRGRGRDCQRFLI